jgi:DNA-binding CsgD family transcriptional regulator
VTTAIIGIGKAASALAEHLVRGGERVVVVGRNASAAAGLAGDLGELAQAAPVREAIEAADTVVFAVKPFEALKKLDTRAYIRDLEQQLRRLAFGAGGADGAGAGVLLVRGALASGDRPRAAELADALGALAGASDGDQDMAAAAAHARGLVDRDPATLERAASTYRAGFGRAAATEDAGLALEARGHHDAAVARLRQAYPQYQQLGNAEAMARVRSRLRAAGSGLRHWRRAERPAFGWDSLTDTERSIAALVAQGGSNRAVAGQLFVSEHTVAAHLRRIFWKLGLDSRVQLARLVPAQSQHSLDVEPGD